MPSRGREAIPEAAANLPSRALSPPCRTSLASAQGDAVPQFEFGARAVDLGSGREDGIHRMARAKYRCCSTSPETPDLGGATLVRSSRSNTAWRASSSVISRSSRRRTSSRSGPVTCQPLTAVAVTVVSLTATGYKRDGCAVSCEGDVLAVVRRSSEAVRHRPGRALRMTYAYEGSTSRLSMAGSLPHARRGRQLSGGGVPGRPDQCRTRLGVASAAGLRFLDARRSGKAT